MKWMPSVNPAASRAAIVMPCNTRTTRPVPGLAAPGVILKERNAAPCLGAAATPHGCARHRSSSLKMGGRGF
jgi:hypothetical protein